MKYVTATDIRKEIEAEVRDGMKQTALARRFGINVTTLSLFLSGRHANGKQRLSVPKNILKKLGYDPIPVYRAKS